MSIILDGTNGITSPDVVTNDGQVYAKENILGTVSQSAGVPTGAIIERDSNANGEYVKYADGTMICLVKTGVTQTSSGGIYTVTYPSPFSSATSNFQVAFGSEDQNASFTRFYDVSSVSTETSNNSLRAYLGVATLLFPIRYAVIGRWY